MKTPQTAVAVALRGLKRFPGIRPLLERRRYAGFLSEAGLNRYHGVFGSFAEVRRELPASREFDRSELTAEYANVRMHRLYAYDYPVLYWMRQAFARGSTTVYDIGGSVGVHYYAYRKFLPYPEGLVWNVCELPAVGQVGRELSSALGATGLVFTEFSNWHAIDADIWISAGALQYIEDARLRNLLVGCTRMPKHIILNKLPVYDGPEFVTSQNIGMGSYAPLHVYDWSRLVSDVESLGYQLIDEWQVPERSLHIPGHPEKSIECFSGAYFRSTNSIED